MSPKFAEFHTGLLREIKRLEELHTFDPTTGQTPSDVASLRALARQVEFVGQKLRLLPLVEEEGERATASASPLTLGADGPHEMTRAEAQEQFLDQLHFEVWSWYENGLGRIEPPALFLAALTELAKHFLALFDYMVGDLPRFALLPAPREDDERWNRAEGQNWFRRLPLEVLNCDIGPEISRAWQARLDERGYLRPFAERPHTAKSNEPEG